LQEQLQVIVMQRHAGEGENSLLAFATDEVCDVADIEPTKMQPLPNTRFDFDERLVDGMHKVNDEFCMQVNIETFYKGEIEELILGISKQKTH
jgi:chemotaxis signal transduction protein